MKRTTISILLASAVLGGWLLNRTLAQQAPAPQPPAPARIAVCDVVHVINQSDWSEDVLSKLGKQRAAMVARRKKVLDEADQKRKELKVLKEGSAEYARRQFAIRQVLIRLGEQEKLDQAQAENERYFTSLNQYNKIREIVAQIAKQRGIDIVLYQWSGALSAQSASSLLQRIDDQKVLYVADGKDLDITEEVMKRVNAAYAAMRK